MFHERRRRLFVHWIKICRIKMEGVCLHDLGMSPELLQYNSSLCFPYFRAQKTKPHLTETQGQERGVGEKHPYCRMETGKQRLETSEFPFIVRWQTHTLNNPCNSEKRKSVCEIKRGGKNGEQAHSEHFRQCEMFVRFVSYSLSVGAMLGSGTKLCSTQGESKTSQRPSRPEQRMQITRPAKHLANTKRAPRIFQKHILAFSQIQNVSQCFYQFCSYAYYFLILEDEQNKGKLNKENKAYVTSLITINHW